MQKKKRLGSFYTPMVLADWIVRRIVRNKGMISSILEPSCGDGIFIRSALTYIKNITKIMAVDIDDDAIENVRQSIRDSVVDIINGDFLFMPLAEKFDLIIGNPPYISKKSISASQAQKCTEIHAEANLAKKEVSNIWTSFLIKSCSLVDDSGVVSFVLPAEFLQVKYAKEIRDFIVSNFARTEILSFRNFRFDDTEQNTIVLLAYKQTKDCKGVFFKEINSINELSDDLVFMKSELDDDTKWTANCLNRQELDVINKVITSKYVKKIDNYCVSVAGIVTAANSYFIMNKDNVSKYNLHKYVVPIIQKGFFVNGNVVFDENDFKTLEKTNKPCFLLNLTDVAEDDFNVDLKSYLELGEQEQINHRFKCCQRLRWFDVPSIWGSEGFFFKRSNQYPKILVNRDNYLITDSAYRIKMKETYKIENLVYSFYNSFTMLMSEIMGRSYGGGVLELTPNEFKSLPIPYYDRKINFNNFEQKFESKKNIEDILFFNDKIILEKYIGLQSEDVVVLQNAYKKLKKRRIGE